MAESSDDPTLLFTPERAQRSRSRSVPLSTIDLTEDAPLSAPKKDEARQTPRPATSNVLHASPSGRMSEERKQYQDESISDSERDPDEAEIEAIVGEHEFEGKHFMFARYKDKICRKKVARELKASHPDLYQDYQQKKKSGRLDPFDPSASYVHFNHRVKMSIKLDKKKVLERRDRRPTRKAAGIRRDNYESEVPDSAEEEEEESDTYSEESDDHPRRKSSRLTHQKNPTKAREHAFSPKKTRSRTAAKGSVKYASEDSATEDDSPPPAKRSTRSRAAARNARSRMMEDDDDDYEDMEEVVEVASKNKRKKVARRKKPRPAYGLIRGIEDLEDSDAETAPLRAHRDSCEKCHKEPAHILLNKFRKRKGRKKVRKSDEQEITEDEGEYLQNLGGWVRCLKCCVAAHWRCLAAMQRDEILKAAREKDKEQSGDGEQPSKRKSLDPEQVTDFVCGSCSKGGICYVCREIAAKPYVAPQPKEPEVVQDNMKGVELTGVDGTVEASSSIEVPPKTSQSPEPDEESSDTLNNELLFRCNTCKRLAHYDHLPVDDDDDDIGAVDKAVFYQEDNNWDCSDCVSYIFPVEKIIAWRPTASGSVLPSRRPQPVPSYKENLPREYLVKWEGRSYRRAQWVPHMWLLARCAAKLKNFMASGSQVELLDRPVSEDTSTAEAQAEAAAGPSALLEPKSDEEESINKASKERDPLAAAPDAESRIPLPWRTVDRVLDVLLYRSRKPIKKKNRKSMSRRHNSNRVDSEDESADDISPADREEILDIITQGDEPGADVTESAEEYTERTGKEITMNDMDRVVWIFAKWGDLGYEEATWDCPPRPEDFGYNAYTTAFTRYAASQTVMVAKMTKANMQAMDSRGGGKPWNSTRLGIPESGQYDIGQNDPNLKLMDFQNVGVNWLCRNWWHHQSCILADEMGLGKTVQIVTFLGLLVRHATAWPALVIVPTSTITNWVREFTRWAPQLRVVPFYGEAKSRDIVRKYELFHSRPAPNTTGAKYHVLITTYETVTNSKDFSVFKGNPRWEVLVVDEGQRLKNDSSLLFKKLGELNTIHRVIMTGTPLNNNIRELFNLMNFLDPREWNDLEALEREHEELTEELIKDLHERLRPYFLRRVKADVLTLPPKNEVIVPVSMSPLQKEVYKSILSQNLNILQSLATTSGPSNVRNSVIKKTNMNNILMQLRKCLQHPYLIADDIEPKGLATDEAHSKLIDASAKLRLLKSLLPKLKERGHRVLLFSQFVIVLDIVEDFLEGEHYKFLRLDGNTKQAHRQADMDEFNREGSDVFIYLLTTRAGGVGINLWSADTVIIFDPDFNPHQDLQAIARSHRYGQKKPCLVFKVMVKDSAEEKIMQTGKKKLVLDHLIVQKINDDEDGGEDVQSILTYGAKALFENEEDQASREIIYSDADLEKLIEKTETESEEQPSEGSKNTFAFAKVWSAHKDELEELDETAEESPEQADSWAQTLAKVAAERNIVQKEEAYGRGVRRKAALAPKVYQLDSPEKVEVARVKHKGKGKRKTFAGSDGSDFEYKGSRLESVDSSDSEAVMLDAEELKENLETKSTTAVQKEKKGSPWADDVGLCGLCHTAHGVGSCWMTQSSRNLVEYRRMLLNDDDDDEPLELRLEAIQSIDEVLHKRGETHLVGAQPLTTFDANRANNPKPPKVKKPTVVSDTVRSSLDNGVPKPKPTTNEVQALKVSGTIKPITASNSIPTPLASIHKRNETVKQSASSQSASGKSPQETGGHESAKRLTSPIHTQDQPKQKKVRKNGSCPICGQSPHHLAKECPVVLGGPQSVLKALVRLQNEGGHQETVSILQMILRKQRQRTTPIDPITIN